MSPRDEPDRQRRRAALLRQRLQGTGSPRPESTVEPRDRGATAELSFAQEQLWFLQTLRPRSGEYNLPVALRLNGPLDPDALVAALTAVVARHEVLRGRIVTTEGVPTQVIDPPGPLDVPSVDLRSEGMTGFLTFAGEQVDRPFELTGRLLRAHLVTLAATDHVLLLVFHHAVFDGWSVRVLIDELAGHYEAPGAGVRPRAGRPALQYGDYAAWQRRAVESDRFARSLDSWRTRLRDVQATELIPDRPRPARFDPRGAGHAVTIPAGLARDVLRVGRAQRATPFATFLAAFQVLLSKYGGTDDVVVGTPVSGRTRPEVEDLIGFFVNTVVVRSPVDATASFEQHVRQAGQDTLDSLGDQDVPFELVVRHLAPHRDAARHPLFQIAFALNEVQDGRRRIGDAEVSLLRVDNASAKFDLMWTLDEQQDGSYTVEIQYAAVLFDHATIVRIGEQYLRLLRSFADDPRRALGRHDYAEPPSVPALASPAAPPSASGGRHTLHEAFAAVAGRRGDATALTHPTGDVRYADLDVRSNRLAHLLVARGVRPESRVALLMRRTPEAVVAMLAVLKAGGAYVPVDPDLPADRVKDVVADSGAELVVVDDGQEADVSARCRPLRVTPVPVGAARGEPGTPPAVPVHPENLAYLVYTSGSTGRPKGVAVTHANVLRLFACAHRLVGFSADDVWSCTHSFSFDFSVWEVWAALLHGGRAVVVDTDVARSPARLAETLERERVTCLSQTPTAFRGLAEHLTTVAAAPRSLRAVHFGGEALDPSILRPWFDRYGADTPALVNLYGITETTVHVTHRRLTAEDAADGRSFVGRPLPDLTVRLVDRSGAPAGDGVPGEIHVSGPGLARGYWGRPALTAERFTPDPCSPVPGARAYRSGDRARRRDGDLEYLDRIDDQVKIRGFRIELGEVEHAIASHPGVEAAVVTARDEPSGRGLAAYLVTSGAMPAVEDLRAHVARTLPGYMIPAWWVPIPALPLTRNQKLDRARLPAPATAGRQLGQEFVAPAGPVQEAIARAWCQVLGLPRAGAEDNFFALGGDSIKAVQVVGRLAVGRLAITVADLFTHQTIAALAGAVTEQHAEGPDPVEAFALLDEESASRLPSGVSDAYPLSAVQGGMLFEMLADDERNLYHNVTSLRIRDDVPYDVAAFRRAWSRLVAEHELLRTSFDLESYGEPLQLVWSRVAAGVTEEDVRHLLPRAQLDAVHAHTRTQRRAPLDLGDPPLMKLHLHRTGEREFWLTVTECHAVLDGWSHHSLVGQLLASYRAETGADPGTGPGTGSAPAGPGPRRAPRFADFVAAERATARSAGHAAYWAETLASAPPLSLPDDLGAQGTDAFADAVVEIADLTPGLRRLATAARAPLKSVLLAAHLVVLGELSGRRRFSTGLVCNGRLEVPGGDQVMGMFLNTVPFVADLRARDWSDLVGSVLRREIDLLPHRRFPLPEMRARWPRLAPGSEVIFNFLDFSAVDDRTLDHDFATDASPNEAALHVSTEPGALVLSAHAPRLSRENLDRVATLYRTVLERMACDPHGDPAASLQPAGVASAWARWNDTAGPVDRPLQAAIRRSDGRSTALVGGGSTLTYEELNSRADAVASALRDRGVGREDLVAVCLERDPGLVVALLGVLRSGAAYVPLDAAHPLPRRTGQVRDAGPAVLLTDDPSLRAAAEPFVPVVSPSLLLRETEGAAAAPPEPDVRPEQLAYVIHTSGSTGRPKGVAVTHAGLDNLLHDVARAPGLTAGTTLVAVTTVTFDIAALELFGPLAVGGTVVLADRDEAADPWRLARLVERSGATMMQATPVTWGLLLDTGWTAPAPFTALCGGEKLPPDLARRLVAAGAQVWDMYGPTETTVWSMRRSVGPGAGSWQPLANTTVHVLDESLRPVQDGVVGELCVGGLGLARGYLGQPGLTAAGFVPDPFGAAAGARLYRTGDLARRGQGTITLLGRRDHQVKVRGFRIELGEVEAALLTHPGIRSAAVTVHGEGNDAILVAYYTTAGTGTVDGPALHRYLAGTLPVHLLPSTWVPLADLPVTTSGKVDRSALPEPAGHAGPGSARGVGARTRVEHTISRVWSEVLGVDTVHVTDDFFELGGHSLLALKVVGELRRRHGIELTLRDLVTERTVARLAAAVAAPGSRGRDRAAIWFRSSGDKPLLACVHPGGGSGHWYAGLSEVLDDDQPLVALEWPGLNGAEVPLTSVADMADRYLAELRAGRPAGPYHLLGWCGGAAVAWELARRLRAEGEEVDLVLLDPVGDRWLEENFRSELALMRRGEELLVRLLGGTTATPEQDRAEMERILRSVIDDDEGRPVTADALDAGWLGRVRVWRQMLEVQIAYEFPPLPGDLRLVLGDEVARGEHEVIRGHTVAEYVSRWRHLTEGEVSVVRTSGDHFDVLRPPHVRRLRDILFS